MGRGPKATTSRVYCMARGALNDCAGAPWTQATTTAKTRTKDHVGTAAPGCPAERSSAVARHIRLAKPIPKLLSYRRRPAGSREGVPWASLRAGPPSHPHNSRTAEPCPAGQPRAAVPSLLLLIFIIITDLF